ncbi:LptF/LptG family permease [Treponema vincentii]|uniref:LptF/LptG family permease n=1 Tax=Treponema vincentii TaxID=69710 RepID=UPI0022AB29C1|nr:LptF/LptG family permease [Treponema vincentii]
MFYFEDRILIHFQRQKIALVNSILEPQQNLNSNDLVVLSDSGKVVYFADYYDDNQKELNNVLIVIRTESGDISTIIKGNSAQWQTDHWEVTDKSIYTFTADNEVLSTKIQSMRNFFRTSRNLSTEYYIY